MISSLKTMDMTPLRQEVRALLPDNNIDQAKAPEIHECIATLRTKLKEYADAHPDYTACDVKRTYYELIPELAPLFIYRNSPFYYEAGINGGWYVNKPGWTPRELTIKYMIAKVPQEEQSVFSARRGSVVAPFKAQETKYIRSS